MSIGYEWRIGATRGGGVADSLEDVSAGLTAAIRDAYDHQGPEVLAGVLTRVWGPLRHSLLTDGASALAAKPATWQGSAGPITVGVWSL